MSTEPLDEHGLPALSSLAVYDGPDGGVWIGVAPMRSIADEIEGKPDDRVAMFVLLTWELRLQLGAWLCSGHSFGPPPTGD